MLRSLFAVAYAKPDYQQFISVFLQCVAAVFAFIAGTATLLMQQIAGSSPTSLRVFPRKWTMAILGFLFLWLTIDGVAVVTLPEVPFAGQVVFYNGLLVSHVVPAGLVVLYVYLVMKWMKPATVITSLQNSAKAAKRDADGRTLLQALDELASTMVGRRFTSAIDSLVKSYSEIAKMAARLGDTTTDADGPDGEASTAHLLPTYVSQLGRSLCDQHLDHYVAGLAAPLRDLLEGCNSWSSPTRRHEVAARTGAACRVLLRSCAAADNGTEVDQLASALRAWAAAKSNPLNAADVALCLSESLQELLRHKHLTAVTSMLDGLSLLTEDEFGRADADAQVREYAKEAVAACDALAHEAWLSGPKYTNMLELLRTQIEQWAVEPAPEEPAGR